MRLRILAGQVAAIVWLAACEPAPDFDHYILALSWQPAFCERHAEKPECRDLDDGDFAAMSPALHGLWPSATDGSEVSYCGVAPAERQADEAGAWCAMPATGADDGTDSDLVEIMPGSASCLDRHEWLKHGTCSGLGADAYFDVSIRLTEAFQATRLAAVVRDGIGAEVPLRVLIEAFEEDFGADSAAALTFICRRADAGAYLAEIRLALHPEAVDKPLSRNSLFLNRPSIRGNCPRQVVIDAVGPG